MAENSRKPRDRDADRMSHSVARFGERRRKWRDDAGRTLLAAFNLTGIGWVVVVPTVLGFVLGHYLDARFSSGITLAAGMGFLGLGLGCWSAWRRIER